jgi:FtsZ-binding cell division protein ZapB
LTEQAESLQRKLDKVKERNESLFEKNVQYLTSSWKLQDQVEEMEEKVNALEQEQDNFKNTISELRSSNRNLGRLLLSLKGILFISIIIQFKFLEIILKNFFFFFLFF